MNKSNGIQLRQFGYFKEGTAIQSYWIQIVYK